MTGLWQVSGKTRTTFAEMVRLDIEYVRRMSLWLDLGIILRTIPALVGQMRDTRRRAKEFQHVDLVRENRDEPAIPVRRLNQQ